MAAAQRRKRRAVCRPAAVCLVLALLAAWAAALLCTGKTCRIRLDADSERLSPTLHGALAREGIDLAPLLDALKLDATLTLAELRAEDGPLAARLQAAAALAASVEQLFSNDRLRAQFRAPSVQAVYRMNEAFALAGTGLRVVSLGTLALLTLATLLLVLRRIPAAALLTGLCALTVGVLPLLLVQLTRSALRLLHESMATVQRYGIGIRLSLELTDNARAQVLLAAGALLLCAAGWFLLARRKPTRRPATPR